jgi:hypothetical protein
LLVAGLVDEIRTFTFPLVLGKGKRLFGGDSQPRAFKLTHSAVSPNGLITATYMRDGEVKTATVGGANENPQPPSWRVARSSSERVSGVRGRRTDKVNPPEEARGTDGTRTGGSS